MATRPQQTHSGTSIYTYVRTLTFGDFFIIVKKCQHSIHPLMSEYYLFNGRFVSTAIRVEFVSNSTQLFKMNYMCGRSVKNCIVNFNIASEAYLQPNEINRNVNGTNMHCNKITLLYSWSHNGTISFSSRHMRHDHSMHKRHELL